MLIKSLFNYMKIEENNFILTSQAEQCPNKYTVPKTMHLTSQLNNVNTTSSLYKPAL